MHANEPIDASYPELFPKDFGERLARLVELAGLSWEEFAGRLGVECDRVTEWRGGEVPMGGEVWPHHAPGVVRSRRDGGDASSECGGKRGR